MLHTWSAANSLCCDRNRKLSDRRPSLAPRNLKNAIRPLKLGPSSLRDTLLVGHITLDMYNKKKVKKKNLWTDGRKDGNVNPFDLCWPSLMNGGMSISLNNGTFPSRRCSIQRSSKTEKWSSCNWNNLRKLSSKLQQVPHRLESRLHGEQLLALEQLF